MGRGRSRSRSRSPEAMEDGRRSRSRSPTRWGEAAPGRSFRGSQGEGRWGGASAGRRMSRGGRHDGGGRRGGGRGGPRLPFYQRGRQQQQGQGYHDGGGGGYNTSQERDVPQERSKQTIKLSHMRAVECTVKKVLVYFKYFGTIERITCAASQKEGGGLNSHPSVAFVMFSTEEEADAAYRSKEAVLGNRFIRVTRARFDIPDTGEHPEHITDWYDRSRKQAEREAALAAGAEEKAKLTWTAASAAGDGDGAAAEREALRQALLQKEQQNLKMRELIEKKSAAAAAMEKRKTLAAKIHRLEQARATGADQGEDAQLTDADKEIAELDELFSQ